MDKNLQKAINRKAIHMHEKAVLQYRSKGAITTEQLRYCSAEIIKTDDYFLLRSYNTIVAVIDRHSNTISDVLRVVYGYTATSAQHIAKFVHDYTPYPWNSERLTARPIKKVVSK